MRDERQHILIVDDRPENLLALESILERPDLNILKANSGNEALGLILEYDIALVLLDVQMPGMDGFETAELMRGNSTTNHIPIIFVTAISKEQKYVFKGYEIGAVDYLFKPLEPDILISKVNVFLDLHKKNTELKKTYEEITFRHQELEETHKKLKDSQSTILQQEKMASIGQLAAGVAHEINNPMGYISSNLGTLSEYSVTLVEFIRELSKAADQLNGKDWAGKLKEKWKQLEIDYILEDIEPLIKESLKGTERVKKIVENLKSFSRVDQTDYKHADLNECIESTLNIIWNEIKYKAAVEKEYGNIPSTECYPQQLNQVFMNLIINAAQAIEKQGTIKIKTWNGDGTINISISDTGCGVPEDKLEKIFDPFFTTKEVGKGTGLGLSICYEIIKKHDGEITVDSKTGEGTTFTIRIPVMEDNSISSNERGES